MSILNFRQFIALNESLSTPTSQILLDGTSSSGKSVLLKKVPTDFCVLAVDEFYDLMAEKNGNVSFNNDKTIDEIYPGCPYSTEPDSEDWEISARWYMAQEAKHGKIKEAGLKSRNPKMGRSEDQSSVIYDDVQGTILKFAKPKPTWILIHAPIDHIKSNVDRRPANDRRDLDKVLIGAYCFKFEALPKKGGVDPEKSWTLTELHDLFGKSAWVKEFADKLGITDDSEYWIHAKSQPEGKYDVVINTRTEDGKQKSISELSQEFLSKI